MRIRCWLRGCEMGEQEYFGEADWFCCCKFCGTPEYFPDRIRLLGAWDSFWIWLYLLRCRIFERCLECDRAMWFAPAHSHICSDRCGKKFHKKTEFVRQVFEIPDDLPF